jgi:hypothetical protein
VLSGRTKYLARRTSGSLEAARSLELERNLEKTEANLAAFDGYLRAGVLERELRRVRGSTSRGELASHGSATHGIDSTTSDGTPRMVDAIGATVTVDQ